jgi:hypothetical protein
MARRVFFSFHYEHDNFRANQVRNANVVVGPDVAGFFDHSEYEEAKKKGDEAIRRMILGHLDRTSVTVVLIGRHTASRPWVLYEIAESIKRKNGLLGIYIDHLWAPGDPPPSVLARILSPTRILPPKPMDLPGVEFPHYIWDGDVRRFAQAIEQAGQRSDKLRQPPPAPPSLFRPVFPPRRFY